MTVKNAHPIRLTGPQLQYALDAVRETKGIVIRAAQRCHVSRATFYLWLAGTPELREAVDEARDTLAAQVHDNVVDIALNPEHMDQFKACCLILDAHGHSLGYGRRDVTLTLQPSDPLVAARALLGLAPPPALPDIVVDDGDA